MAKKILVVDNHVAMRTFMFNFFSKKGHEIVVAEDGLAALEILTSYIPDIIFSELIMPNISGEKFGRIIRERTNLDECFIVVVSAITAEQEISLKDLGADILLAKGSFENLFAKLDLIMELIESGREDLIKGMIIGYEGMQKRQITCDLLDSKNHHELTLKNMSEGLLEIVDDSKIIYANPVAISIIGISEEKLLSLDFVKLFQENDQAIIRQQISKTRRTGREVATGEAIELNGRLVIIKSVPMYNNKSIRRSMLVMIIDVTLQKQAEKYLIESEQKYKRERHFLDNIFQNSPDAIAIVDENDFFIRCNERAVDMFGFNIEELKDKKAFELFKNLEKREEMSAILLDKGYIQNYELDIKCKNETALPCAVSISLLWDENSKEIGTLYIIRDITQWKQAQEKLIYLSFHDGLTGLYNRSFFEEEIKRLALGRHLPLSIIICDIDFLKLINDNMGHQKGDEVIQVVAGILRKSFRSSDIIARIGGDEFAVLLPKSDVLSVKDCLARVKREVKDFNERQNAEYNLSISIGLATKNETPLDIAALFKEADDHMYSEKIKKFWK